MTDGGTSKVMTAWGTAALVERVIVPQRAGAKRFASVVELLERPDGERFIRFAYTTDGVARRGPVSLRPRDLERLRKGFADAPELAAILRAGLGMESGSAEESC